MALPVLVRIDDRTLVAQTDQRFRIYKCDFVWTNTTSDGVRLVKAYQFISRTGEYKLVWERVVPEEVNFIRVTTGVDKNMQRHKIIEFMVRYVSPKED